MAIARTVARSPTGALQAPLYDPAMAGSGPTIQIPRWIQLVVLPVALVLAFLLAKTLGHVLFLFLTASVIAFTLNPLVRDLTRLKVPRGLSVCVVYVIFLAVAAALLIAIGAVAVDQAREAADRIDEYVTENTSGDQTAAELDIDRLQAWLDDHGLEQIQIREQINEWLDGLSAGEISGYAQDAISFAQGAAFSFVLLMFSVILIVVISIYMLLDMQRLERTDRLALPAARRCAAHPADRGRAVGVSEGTGDPLDGHRDERRRRHVHPRRDRARRGGRRSTRSSSASGRPSSR